MSNPKVKDGPEGLDWEVSRFADWDMALTVFEEFDDGTPDAPVDLSGYTFVGTVKTSPTGTVVTTLTGTGTADSQILLSKAHADTGVDNGEYVWSVWETAPSRTPWFEGTLTVLMNVVTTWA